MATLGTQNNSTSYPQLLKVSGNTPFTSTLLALATGDESSVSARKSLPLGLALVARLTRLVLLPWLQAWPSQVRLPLAPAWALLVQPLLAPASLPLLARLRLVLNPSILPRLALLQ